MKKTKPEISNEVDQLIDQFIPQIKEDYLVRDNIYYRMLGWGWGPTLNKPPYPCHWEKIDRWKRQDGGSNDVERWVCLPNDIAKKSVEHVFLPPGSSHTLTFAHIPASVTYKAYPFRGIKYSTREEAEDARNDVVKDLKSSYNICQNEKQNLNNISNSLSNNDIAKTTNYTLNVNNYYKCLTQTFADHNSDKKLGYFAQLTYEAELDDATLTKKITEHFKFPIDKGVYLEFIEYDLVSIKKEKIQMTDPHNKIILYGDSYRDFILGDDEILQINTEILVSEYNINLMIKDTYYNSVLSLITLLEGTLKIANLSASVWNLKKDAIHFYKAPNTHSFIDVTADIAKVKVAVDSMGVSYHGIEFYRYTSHAIVAMQEMNAPYALESIKEATQLVAEFITFYNIASLTSAVVASTATHSLVLSTLVAGKFGYDWYMQDTIKESVLYQEYESNLEDGNISMHDYCEISGYNYCDWLFEA